MRIVHRMEGRNSVERLVSLDGSGREIVRTPREVHAYLPDRRVVLVEPRTDGGSLLKALPTPGAELDAQYLLEARSGSRLLGRDVRVIEIRPRDAYRYGYRLWLDEKTAMPLRSEICDQAGRAVERIQFTQARHAHQHAGQRDRALGRRVRFPLGALGAAGRRPPRGRDGLAPAQGASRVPPGRLTRPVSARESDAGAAPRFLRRLRVGIGVHRARIAHVRRHPPKPRGWVPRARSLRPCGATSITAVGEVPPTTVRDIATSLAPASDVGASAPPAR